MNYGVIVQARMTSSRLPGKVMLELNGKPMLYWQLMRILSVVPRERLVLATSIESSDEQIVELAANEGIRVFRGSLNNVYSRYVQLLRENNWTHFVRLTGDCPLVMPNLLSRMLNSYEESQVDYFSNTLERDFPRGLDVEIVRVSSFLNLEKYDLSSEELEHVTVGLYKRPNLFKILNYSENRNLKKYRWTVDTSEDFEFVKRIYTCFAGRELEIDIDDLTTIMSIDSSLKRFDFI